MERENLERVPERSSHIILPMEGLAGKISLISSLHESNFACYKCISNITICGRTVEIDYQKIFSETGFSFGLRLNLFAHFVAISSGTAEIPCLE